MNSTLIKLFFLLLLTNQAFPQVSPKPGNWKLRTAEEAGNSAKALKTSLEKKARTQPGYVQLSSKLDKVNNLMLGCLSSLSENDYSNDELVDKYFDEIGNYSLLLKSAENSSSPDSIDAILNFIESDLSYKYDNSPEPSEITAHLVSVRVRVLDSSGSQELVGYNVFVKPELSVDPLLVETFNPTRNAVKEITPGRKIVWIEKNGIRVQERRTGIRKSSNPEEQVDFVIIQ